MKKYIASIIVAVMFLSISLPTGISYAQNEENEQLETLVEEILAEETLAEETMSEKEIANMEKIVSIIDELDKQLNMHNLSENKESDIQKLDQELQDFYFLYKQLVEQNHNQSAQENVLAFLSYYYEYLEESNPEKTNNIAARSIIGSVKEYKLSNQQVVTIGKLVGLHGTGWTFAVAVAKAFKKSPTLITMLIGAVPALGYAALNVCNKYDKGVIITKLRIGASNSFSCKARK